METCSNTPPLDRGSIHLKRAHVGSQRIFVGRLENLPDARGLLEASFAGEGVPALRMGQHVELCFLDEEPGTARAYLSQVVSRRELEGGQSFRFRVKLRANDVPGPELTRRAADRVCVDEWTSSSLRIQSLEGAEGRTSDEPGAESVLLDLSRSGAQILVPFELEAQLFAADTVRVSFRLGDSPGGPCQVQARIRWREMGEGGVRYGLQFLFDDSPEHARWRERIATYVEARRAQARARGALGESSAA